MLLSAVTVWEIACLVDAGRLDLDIPVEPWVERFLNCPGIEVVWLDYRAAARSYELHHLEHRDPADRLLIAGSDDAIRSLRDNPHLIGVDISRTRAFRRNKAWIAMAAMAAVVLLSALDMIGIGMAAFIAVGIILVTRCIDPEEAWAAIDGDVLILIFAMLAVGLGLERAGSVALMVGWITPLLTVAPVWSLVFIIYFFALLLSELLSNNAVAALLTPITIALAQQLGVDPRPLVIALMIGASACFATPIGYQTNALVYAAGDYRFADFVRIGVPINIIVGLAVCSALVLLG